MTVHRIVMEVDEGWLKAIADLTNVDIHEGEVCNWLSNEVIDSRVVRVDSNGERFLGDD